MREYNHGRSRRQQRLDRDSGYDDMEEHVDSKARERFRRKPYTSYGVEDCLRKWGVDMKGDVASGQEDAEKA